MSRRDPGLLMEDLIESGEKILAYTGTMSFEAFLSDPKTVDAAIANGLLKFVFLIIDHR